jgi:CDP-glucose 4,6-dehydratase
VRAVVIVTSDKCYENREWVWGYRESDPMGGYDPYSNSKGCAELVTAAYRRSFFSTAGAVVGVASARAGNVIGGGDFAKDRIVPDFVRARERGVPLLVRSPNAVRPWQHVLEPLAGYLRLAERLYEDPARYSDAWNFGPGDEDARPVSFVVDHLAREWGDAAAWKTDRASHPHEAHYLKLDCSKARAELDFRPRLPLTETLRWVATWYRGFLAKESALDMTLRQIKAYEALEPRTVGS